MEAETDNQSLPTEAAAADTQSVPASVVQGPEPALTGTVMTRYSMSEARLLRRAMRREKVKDLFARGRTYREIAAILSVDLSTVQTDMAVLKQEISQELASQTVVDIASMTIMEYDLLKREAFKMIQPRLGSDGKVVESVTPTDKIAAFNLIRNIIKDRIAHLEKLDVVFKVPERVSVYHVVMNKLATLPIRVQRQIADASDDAEFERLIAQHVGVQLAAQFVRDVRINEAKIESAEGTDTDEPIDGEEDAA